MAVVQGNRAGPRWKRRRVLAALGVVFMLAATLGAYLDWIWWLPYSGVVLTLGAGAILLVGLVLATTRRSREIGLVLGVVGVGLVAGQNLGPSRPTLLPGDGTMDLTLTSPVAVTGSGLATCAVDEAGTELQISGDFRLNVSPDDPSIPADVDQREFVGLYLTVGDRWGRSERSDDAALEFIVHRVEADSLQSRMTTAVSSSLELDWTVDRGTARFAGLVPNTRFEEATGEFYDLAGTIAWTCMTNIR
ncbi:MAG TPA: hypothetical protein VM344_06470 [Vitreimonas sp.]|nr:hypothetical protein [Vitreimonas sp.]